MNKNRNYLKTGHYIIGIIAIFGLFLALPAFAADKTLVDLSTGITTSFTAMGKLMIATAYLAGFAFVITAIFKFKQHRDNPTQIPMGTPIALLVIGIILIFLPGIIAPAGSVIFGNNTSSAAGGFKGNVSGIPGGNQ